MPNMKIRPISGRVLLQILEPVERQGKLFVRRPLDRGSCREAVVKALPNGYRGELEVGDRVLCPPWPDRELRLNRENIVFVDADRITCVLEE